jgi:hypothetical protein
MNALKAMNLAKKEVHMSEVADKVYMEFANRFHQFVIDNPICQICKLNPSIRITRWGKVKSACQQCLIKEHNDFIERIKESYDNDIEY